MSMDQYSRHADDDESGLVPPQGTQPADRPRKIRSLSTDDLDRLTIDSAGRFYWDGQLVNYGFAKPDGQLLDARELSSLASPHKETTTGGTAMADPVSPTSKDSTLDALADALAATPAPTEAPTIVVAAPAAPTPAPSVEPAPAVRRETDVVVAVTDKPRRFKLSAWQSIGAFFAVLSLLLAAAGLAASGFASAHEWSCRAGFVTAYCPPKPAPAPARPRGIID
jgi:hypothetical protein